MIQVGDNTLLFVLGYLFYNYSKELKLLVVYILSFGGIYHYTITGDKETAYRVLKQLDRDRLFASSHIIYKGIKFPQNLLFTRQCIAFVEMDGWTDMWKIKILGRTQYIESLLQEETHTIITDTSDSEDEQIQPQIPVSITVFTRLGSYREFFYRKLKLNVTDLQPKGEQSTVTKTILDLYTAKKRCTIFLSGPPATGKSSVGYLVAKELKAAFCHSFNPTDPGDNIYGLLVETRADDPERPIVIVLEESNMLLRKIHTGAVPVNEKVPTSVYDKMTWCNFLDDMAFYKHVVLILTSNEQKQDIDALDPAYLRKGRVDAMFEMTQSVLA